MPPANTPRHSASHARGRAAAIVALGIPLASVLAFEALLLVATIFHHSNLLLPPRLERALAAIVVTPSILSLWDPLFRSRSAMRRAPDMKIGVEGQGEESLATLLIRPFRRV